MPCTGGGCGRAPVKWLPLTGQPRQCHTVGKEHDTGPHSRTYAVDEQHLDKVHRYAFNVKDAYDGPDCVVHDQL